MTLALGVLISGSGTNLGAILDAVRAGELDARVAVVISNRAGVQGLTRAAEAGVPAEVVSHKDFPSREAFDAAVVERLRAHGVDTVMLAGFMRVVTGTLLGAFEDRVLNVHPALLPAFPGVDAQRQALEYGAKITGATVHFVDSGVDTGPVIAQAAVPVLDGDDREKLAARILEQEHRLVVHALRLLAAGRLRLSGAGEGRRRCEVLA